jgi:hypothetical protein
MLLFLVNFNKYNNGNKYWKKVTTIYLILNFKGKL